MRWYLRKWLRSSLFKNNSDTFVFEENINVKVEHYDNSLKDIRDVVVSGKLTRGGQDKIYADLLIKGNFEMISGKTLKEVVVPFEIEEREEYVDKSVFAGEEVFDVNLMDMYIDLTPLVNDLLTLVGDPAKPIFAGSISISSNVQVSIGLSNTSTIAPTFIYLGWLASASTVTNPGVGSSNKKYPSSVALLITNDFESSLYSISFT